MLLKPTWHSLPLPLLLLLRPPFCSVVGALHALLSDSSVLLPIVRSYCSSNSSRQEEMSKQRELIAARCCCCCIRSVVLLLHGQVEPSETSDSHAG
jgi:hypothetical protein